MPLHPVTLEEWELLKLDGKCSPKTQALIAEIQKRLPQINPLDKLIPKRVESLPGQKSLFE